MNHFFSLWLLVFFALCRPTDALSSASPDTSGLSFVVGGVDLKPQEFPSFLNDYHSKTIEMTEQALEDSSLIVSRGVSYGSQEHQKLDIWTPMWTPSDGSSEGSSLLPIVVMFHGGGWDFGYREWVGFCAKPICKEGAKLVAPSYTLGLGTEQAWPKSRDDIITVLQWLTKNGASYGGDPSRIILVGHSAGGHLAACVGFDTALLESSGLDVSSIKALFLLSTPLGLQPKHFFGSLKWKLAQPIAQLIYQKKIMRFLRPITGDKKSGNNRRKIAKEASPLVMLQEQDNFNGVNGDKNRAPFVHYAYAKTGDFPFCPSHGKQLVKRLGEGAQVLEIPVDSHFGTHYALADEKNEWYDVFRKVLSSS